PAVVLHAEGRIGERAVFELGVGPTPVQVDATGTAWMTQKEATFGAALEDRPGLAAALRLDTDDVRSDLPIQVVSTGNEFLLLPLASEDALRRAAPNFGNWGAGPGSAAPRSCWARASWNYPKPDGGPGPAPRYSVDRRLRSGFGDEHRSDRIQRCASEERRRRGRR